MSVAVPGDPLGNPGGSVPDGVHGGVDIGLPGLAAAAASNGSDSFVDVNVSHIPLADDEPTDQGGPILSLGSTLDGDHGAGALVSIGDNTDGDGLVAVGASSQNDALVSIGDNAAGDGLVAVGDSSQNDALVSIGDNGAGNDLVAVGDSPQNDALVSIGDNTEGDGLVTVGDSSQNDAFVSIGGNTDGDGLVVVGDSPQNDALVSIGDDTDGGDLVVAGGSSQDDALVSIDGSDTSLSALNFGSEDNQGVLAGLFANDNAADVDVALVPADIQIGSSADVLGLGTESHSSEIGVSGLELIDLA